MINGLTDQPTIDEFLARLIQHQDQFEIGEENLQRTKDISINRSISMYPKSNVPITRFLSSDPHPSYLGTNTFLPHAFQRMTIHPDDEDDVDEDEDDDDKTPTVNRPLPKFSHE